MSGDKSTPYMKKVAAYVENMGSKMDYHVAVDVLSRKTANNWMVAADQPGLPFSFVVDKKGKIAWMGDPTGDLDGVLEAVVQDKYDPKTWAAKAKKNAAERDKLIAEKSKLMALIKEPLDLVQERKFDEAIDKLDTVIKANPTREAELSFFRFSTLLQFDTDRALDYAKRLSEGIDKDKPAELNQLARAILQETTIKDVNYMVALNIAERLVQITQKSDKLGISMDTLAIAQYKVGYVDQAIESETKALELIRKNKDTPADAIQAVEERLARYKSSR